MTVDALPNDIRDSKILTASHLVQLASFKNVPEVDPSFYDDTLKNIFQYYSLNPAEMETEMHIYAGQLLNQGKVAEAWQVLLAGM